MAVTRYNISVLDYNDCQLKIPALKLKEYLQAWRLNHSTSNTCNECHEKLAFHYKHTPCNFTVCCKHFYFKPMRVYLVQSIAVKTPNIAFLPSALAKYVRQSSQEFLIFPDPQYWLVTSTLTFDRILNFVLGLPLSKRTKTKPKSSLYYYKQIQNVPLNHGSLEQRAQGKNTYWRKIGLAKRSELTLRAMIIPAPFLKPNEIVIPESMEKELHLKGKWIIVNRMPSLIPENFVGLKVTSTWSHDCFGIPLEIVNGMNADFDGDECNASVIDTIQAQAECATLLNSRVNMSSFTMGTKLSPCHDMLVTYYLKYDEIDFLPYKHPDLKKTFRVLYDLYGSEKCFDYVDRLREYYLKFMQDEILFALTLQEFDELETLAKDVSFEEFVVKVMKQFGKTKFENLEIEDLEMNGSEMGDSKFENSKFENLEDSKFENSKFENLEDLKFENSKFENLEDLKFENSKFENSKFENLEDSKFENSKFENLEIGEFENKNNCILTQILSGAKGTLYHLYQLVGSVGLQFTQHTDPIAEPYIKSSFLKGLEPMELIVHAQAGFDAFINASSVWVPGYNFFKLVNNLQDLTVNYKGQLVDKNSVLADDILNAMYYEDVLSKESFDALIHNYLKN